MERQSPMAGSKEKAGYMLRRNLAFWKPAETIKETVAFCIRTGIGEIIWKIDPEAFNHGFTPHDLIRRYLPWLGEARSVQAARGIVFSINPWVTLNHAYRGRYRQGPPAGFHWRIRPDGTESQEQACPLAPGWKEWFLGAYALYARARPDKLWLEDDFRTFSAVRQLSGCYCPDHLRLFAAATGRAVAREELAERLVAPGRPDPLRAAWFDFQGIIMVGICRDVERVVHAVSPDTRLGLMCSWSTDGRWWAEAVTSLAGSHRPLARTSLAAYHETRATGFLPDAFDILKETACLPAGTENCPELENLPYTPYSKSARMTRLQLIVSQLLGNKGITMNLFDMVGAPVSSEPRFERMLKETKPILDAIAGVSGPAGISRGVGIPYDKKYADHLHLASGCGYESPASDGQGWMVPLQGAGVPCVLNGTGPVRAATGQSVRSLDRGGLEELLSGGLLLDGSAAAVLAELGYSEYIGVEPGRRVDRYDIFFAAERDEEESRHQSTPVYLSLANIARPEDGRLYPLGLRPGAAAVSVYVNPDGEEVMPALTVFENKLGGRVAVYPFDFSAGIADEFMNWPRKQQLQRTIRWLSRDAVDLFVSGGQTWMMPIRRDYPDRILAAAVNLETDDWDGVSLTFRCDRDHGDLSFRRLDRSGRWRTCRLRREQDGENVRVEFPGLVPSLDCFVVLISWCRGGTNAGKESIHEG